MGHEGGYYILSCLAYVCVPILDASKDERHATRQTLLGNPLGVGQVGRKESEMWNTDIKKKESQKRKRNVSLEDLLLGEWVSFLQGSQNHFVGEKVFQITLFQDSLQTSEDASSHVDLAIAQ